MKKQKTAAQPRTGRGRVPGAALATGLLSPMAFGAAGDLDPGFADLGRLVTANRGPAWSIELQDDDSLLLAGGTFESYCTYYYYYCGWGSYRPGNHASNFVSRVNVAGAIDPAFALTQVAAIQVLDITRQPGGEIVAVGRNASPVSNNTRLAVFRLLPNGDVDSTFGDDGVFRLESTGAADSHTGTSVVLEPDGRIVVAGSRNGKLLVLRLLPDGSIDTAFGSSGVVTGPENLDVTGMRTTVLRSAGGYRVSISNSAGCQVVALTAGGALDPAFGSAGISTIASMSGPTISCSAVVNYSDGRLLAVGKAAGNAFATRLLANGQADPGFSAGAVSSAMTAATSVALAQDDSVIVAGEGIDGASIVRLLANGDLDPTFGNAGSALIDLPSEEGALPTVHDMIVRADGGIVVAGGNQFGYYVNQAFVARLLGPGPGGSPGVLGFAEQNSISTAEGESEAVIQVRRSGGDAGSVSVAYRAVTPNGYSAEPGEDYERVSGRLTWNEGDRSDKEVRVPILADDMGEEQEAFRVSLSDVQGSAGLAKRSAYVSIRPDGGPYGQFEIVPHAESASEDDREAFVYVYRNFYDSGAVSVTVNTASATAIAGEDFVPRSVTLSWADGDTSAKAVTIPLINDDKDEPSESFLAQLADPTGGAVLGPRSSASVIIRASDHSYKSGGGAVGLLSLVLLGLLRACRSLRSNWPLRAGRCGPAGVRKGL